MAALLPTLKLNFVEKIPSLVNNGRKSVALKPSFCSLVQQVEQQDEKVGILCEPCNGSGWLLCDFCNGQKVNVKSQTNRIYRRCPSCKAVACFKKLLSLPKGAPSPTRSPIFDRSRMMRSKSANSNDM